MRVWNDRWCWVILVGLMVSLLVAQPVLADWIKLSGTMPSFGDIYDFVISPDGQYVVYRADQDTDGATELYSVPMTGGTPIRLNWTLPTGTSVADDYQISPNSKRVVYRAPQEATGVDELYSVPITGPAASGVKLNGALVTNGDVLDFLISPDGRRVVYQADQETDDVEELYSVKLGGPAWEGIKLNGALVTGGDVWDFQISPDGSRVIYRADQQPDEVVQLYSVLLAGPAEEGVRLNWKLVTGGNVLWRYQISPDSSRVIYWADQQTDGVNELFSVPISGPSGDGFKLNKMLVAGGEVRDDFQISPDSSRVVYRANQDTIDVNELYSVPLAGTVGEGVKLNGLLVANGDVLDFLVSPDSSRVVYWADQQTDEVYELYSVPLAGPVGAGVKLNVMLVVGGDVEYYKISPDSSRVVYRADQETDEVKELYCVSLAGPAGKGVKLNGTLVTGGDVWDFQISPNSRWVGYRADQEVDEVWDLYSVPLAGPAEAIAKLNGVLVAGGLVGGFIISPDSNQVVYRADQETNGVYELYAADNGQAQMVYLPLVVRGNVPFQ